MIAIDTETTGVDLYHAATAFLLTTYDGIENTYWEWEVNPETREVIVPPEDIVEIREHILCHDRFLFQNAKFDITALDMSGIISQAEWNYEAIEDTLTASHVLSSNTAHDLTSLALRYLDIDIAPYENAIKDAVLEARSSVERLFPSWRIAKKNLEGMPSAKESTWKYDMWLPATIARRFNHHGHRWITLVSEYANADTAVTYSLWKILEHQLRSKGLWEIYRFKQSGLRVAKLIEDKGVTVRGTSVETALKDLQQKANTHAKICTDIAKGYQYDLSLPKSGNNNSLLDFVFTELGLALPPVTFTDTGNPALDKGSLDVYIHSLSPGSPPHRFIENLRDKRKLDTSISYLTSYKRYWIPTGIFDKHRRQLWYLLHPTLNMTGTTTLRWSSSNPNEQNISKQDGAIVRSCFGPARGREWWSCDAKNIELRIPSYEANEEEQIRLFEEPDAPPYYGSNHLLVFSILHPDLWDEMLREVGIDKVAAACKKKYAATEYQWVKNGNFAVQYGAIDRDDGMGTADLAYRVPGAQSIIQNRFKKIEALNQKYIRNARKFGYVETIPDKTVNPNKGYPLMCGRTESGGIRPTVPLNYHVQGSAMWWTHSAMVKCQCLLDEWNRKLRKPEYFIIMQVHDEIVFDFPRAADPFKNPKKSNLWRIQAIARTMESCGEDWVIRIPTPVGIEYHPDHWGHGMTI